MGQLTMSAHNNDDLLNCLSEQFMMAKKKLTPSEKEEIRALYENRKTSFSTEDGHDHMEISFEEIRFGSRMWYLELCREGFYFCGNTLYANDDWDNDSIVKIGSFENLMSLENNTSIAILLMKDFIKSGNEK